MQLDAADVGIAGKDVCLNMGLKGYTSPWTSSLDIARCKLMTAGVTGQLPAEARRRVATKFV